LPSHAKNDNTAWAGLAKPGLGAVQQQGAALLTAMLTVTLVATFATAALWQQWRSVEIEAAERSRTQMQWVLNGALDWSRLILQEDGRQSEVDHLSEPWALPLQEARLSSFLAVDDKHTDDAMEAFLSGQISDQQALLNVRNLVQEGKPNLQAAQAFARLFDLLHLPQSQLQLLQTQLLAIDASGTGATADRAATEAAAQAPLTPYRMEQLTWLGLEASTVRALSPYCTLLPVATKLNLNTAGAEVLYAALPNLDMAHAQQMVGRRASTHFESLDNALGAAGINSDALPKVVKDGLGINTQYFAVRGRLRLGDSAVQEVSLVERKGQTAKVIWRQREALASMAPSSLQ
jgi:general secretion pathway protein K